MENKLYINTNFLLLGLLIIGIYLLLPLDAFCLTTPASGSFAYDLYDIGVNKVLKGAPGFILGVAGMALAAKSVFTGAYGLASACALGSGILIKADTLITSLGLMV